MIFNTEKLYTHLQISQTVQKQIKPRVGKSKIGGDNERPASRKL